MPDIIKTKDKSTDRTNHENYQIHVENNENASVAKILFEGIKSYNELKIGKYTREPFTIYTQSKDDDKIIGGCDGYTTGKYCYAHRIWVDPKHRKTGIGTQLMLELEKYAKNKNCHTISLDTAEFQAKDFYEKLGYAVVSIVDGIIFPGYKQYFMSKML